MPPAIMNYVQRESTDMLQLLEQLVNIDSGSDDKEGVNRVAQVIKQKFEALGFHVHTVLNKNQGNHLVIQHEEALRPKILILGHMDTVFDRGTAKSRPFTIRGQHAYGPGVVDMKGSLVLVYYAMRKLIERGDDAYKHVQIILNSDEEIGSDSSRQLIEKHARDKMCALVLEPARKDGSIVSARRGVGTYHIHIKGKAAHSGIEPEKGRSAIRELAHKIIAIDALSRPEEGIHVNVVETKGGIASNVISPIAKATIDVRITHPEQAIWVEQQLQDICNQSVINHTTTTLTGTISRPPMPLTEKNMQLVQFIEYQAKQLNIPLTHTSTGGGSDASFPAALGIPTVDGLGPIGGGQHSKHEYLLIPSLIERTNLFIQSVSALAKQPRQMFEFKATPAS